MITSLTESHWVFEEKKNLKQTWNYLANDTWLDSWYYTGTFNIDVKHLQWNEIVLYLISAAFPADISYLDVGFIQNPKGFCCKKLEI